MNLSPFSEEQPLGAFSALAPSHMHVPAKRTSFGLICISMGKWIRRHNK